METRLFVAPTIFRTTLTLLLLHFIVAVLYYDYRPGKYLPRLPTSIAAVISYVYASRALEDFGSWEAESKRRKRRYAFGRFVGTDGKTHIGIERQDYIIPLETRNPGVKRKGGIGVGRLMRKSLEIGYKYVCQTTWRDSTIFRHNLSLQYIYL